MLEIYFSKLPIESMSSWFSHSNLVFMADSSHVWLRHSESWTRQPGSSSHAPLCEMYTLQQRMVALDGYRWFTMKIRSEMAMSMTLCYSNLAMDNLPFRWILFEISSNRSGISQLAIFDHQRVISPLLTMIHPDESPLKSPLKSPRSADFWRTHLAGPLCCPPGPAEGKAGWKLIHWQFPARHGGSPKAGWFIRENPSNMNDLGLPPF